MACSSRAPYRCADSSQCVASGAEGVCEPTGYCSFTDPSCPGGRKYETQAGDGLAGTCIDVTPTPDAPMPVACGAVGQACCAAAETAPCGPNLGCREATCQTCVEDIAFGRHFACALRHDSTVWCVGENNQGQIGIGLPGDTPILEWMQVLDLATSVAVSDATGLALGWEFGCALRTGGTVGCWGANYVGQLGRGDTAQSPAAVAVLVEATGEPLAGIVELAAGDEHACGRTDAGAVWCWGLGTGGQLGDGTATTRTRAVQVLDGPMGMPVTGAVSIAAASDASCLRETDGTTWCWGRNQQGMLGDGTTDDRTTPVAVGMTKGIDLGSWALSCRINLDDTVSCNGGSWRYRLGNGVPNSPAEGSSLVAMPSPVLVEREGAQLAGVRQIVVGGVPCALLVDGSVKCWGDNTHGQNGTGGLAAFPTTVRLADGSPLDRVDRLVAGYSHFCALRDDGALLCWGRGVHGELGTGERADVGDPTPLRFPCP